MDQTRATVEWACAVREDGQHCDHWYDGGACCACGAPAMTFEEKVEQGMLAFPNATWICATDELWVIWLTAMTDLMARGSRASYVSRKPG